MKHLCERGRLGMALLAGALAFVGSADATQLLIDGSFENVTSISSSIVKTGGAANPGLGGGWSTFSTCLYSTEYALPGPSGCGANFLRPYADDGWSPQQPDGHATGQSHCGDYPNSREN